jgi:hypothetical protein
VFPGPGNLFKRLWVAIPSNLFHTTVSKLLPAV